jgi:hypothetical protein
MEAFFSGGVLLTDGKKYQSIYFGGSIEFNIRYTIIIQLKSLSTFFFEFF